jgi:hypothetical protein
MFKPRATSQQLHIVVCCYQNCSYTLGFDTQFEKFTEDFINSYDVDYDYSSIMHYSATAFAKEKGLVTIEPRPRRDVKFGQREHLSASDIKQARAMYGCQETEFIATPISTTQAQTTHAPTTTPQTTDAPTTTPQTTDAPTTTPQTTHAPTTTPQTTHAPTTTPQTTDAPTTTPQTTSRTKITTPQVIEVNDLKKQSWLTVLLMHIQVLIY